jgi:hypothetical protein
MLEAFLRSSGFPEYLRLSCGSIHSCFTFPNSCFTFPKRRYISRQNVRNGEDFAVIYKFKFASEILYRSRKGRELGRRETVL